MENFIVDFYHSEDGSCPVEEFLDSLNLKMRAKILLAVRLLKENGNELRLPYSEHLADGIFELRAKHGSNITRVLYFFVIGRRAVLTHGFVKKTRKAPPSEIEKAKEFRKDFLQREAEHGRL